MLQTLKVKIPANGSLRLSLPGEFVRVDTATTTFRLETPNGDRVVLRQGRSITLVRFTELQLFETEGADNSLVLEVGSGRSDDKEMSGSVGMESPASLVSSADLALVADTNTALFAASTTRKEVIIKAAKTNTVNVRIGDNNISATQGYELEPGQTMVLQNADDVYGRAIGGAATVQRLEGKN